MGFKLKSTEHLFPTPLLRFTVDDADALNRELLAEIAQRRAAEPGVTRSNFGGWHSAKDFFHRPEQAHHRLALDLMRMMAEATRAFDPKLDIARVQLVPDGWINVNQPAPITDRTTIRPPSGRGPIMSTIRRPRVRRG